MRFQITIALAVLLAGCQSVQPSVSDPTVLVRVGFGCIPWADDQSNLVANVIRPEFTRDGAHWDKVEPRPGVYDFSSFDYSFHPPANYRTKFILTIAKEWPSWLPRDSTRWINRHTLLVSAIARHYGDRLYGIDLNEPWTTTRMLPTNATTVAAFGRFLADDTAACVQTLRSIGSRTLYLGPAFDKLYTMETRAYCLAMQKHPRQDWPDGFDFHDYDSIGRAADSPDPSSLRNSLSSLKQWWPDHPPIYVTEFGIADSNTAADIRLRLNLYRAAGARAMIYHNIFGSIERTPNAWFLGQYPDGSLRPKIKTILEEFPLKPIQVP
jgi:hypothetical protein